MKESNGSAYWKKDPLNLFGNFFGYIVLEISIHTQADSLNLFECAEKNRQTKSKQKVIKLGKHVKKGLPSSRGQLLKSTELAQVVQEDSVLGISWFCAILFASWITQKLLFHLAAAS